MIVIKSPSEIATMRKSCRLAASVLDMIEPFVKPGVSTEELDKRCFDYIKENGAVPSPLNYKGYPKSICTSINDVICHGIPDSRTLKEGDIVNLDVTTFLDGFHGDTSKTYTVGKASRAARDLMAATYEALWIGIRAVRPGGHFGDIGNAVQSFVEARGYSIVREYCGHGIGRVFHEDPHVTHYGRKGSGAKFQTGMVFTIEPMVNQGGPEIEQLDDGWTVITRDGKLSAQFEHTVAILEDGLEIMTLSEKASEERIIKF